MAEEVTDKNTIKQTALEVIDDISSDLNTTAFIDIFGATLRNRASNASSKQAEQTGQALQSVATTLAELWVTICKLQSEHTASTRPDYTKLIPNLESLKTSFTSCQIHVPKANTTVNEGDKSESTDSKNTTGSKKDIGKAPANRYPDALPTPSNSSNADTGSNTGTGKFNRDMRVDRSLWVETARSIMPKNKVWIIRTGASAQEILCRDWLRHQIIGSNHEREIQDLFIDIKTMSPNKANDDDDDDYETDDDNNTSTHTTDANQIQRGDAVMILYTHEDSSKLYSDEEKKSIARMARLCKTQYWALAGITFCLPQATTPSYNVMALLGCLETRGVGTHMILHVPANGDTVKCVPHTKSPMSELQIRKAICPDNMHYSKYNLHEIHANSPNTYKKARALFEISIKNSEKRLLRENALPIEIAFIHKSFLADMQASEFENAIRTKIHESIHWQKHIAVVIFNTLPEFKDFKFEDTNYPTWLNDKADSKIISVTEIVMNEERTTWKFRVTRKGDALESL